MMLTAVAAIPYTTCAQAAQQPSRPAVVQRAAPVQHFAPVQHVAPRSVAPHPSPQVHVNINRTTFTQQQNGNSHVVNPSLQHVNPNLQRSNPIAQLNNPNQQRVNPNVQLNNPNLQRVNPNVQLNNPNLQRANPNAQFNNPNLQHVNPNAQFNNPNLQRVNPNVQFNNPNLQRVNPSIQQVNPNVQRVDPNLTHQGGALPLQGANTLKLGPGARNFNPALLSGAGGLQHVKPAFPAVSFHNRFWPILRGPKFLWIAGHRRFFVPLGVLGVAFIGGSYWYPDGYVSIEGPACAGLTPDGCQLQWRMVDFEDGGSEPQCVQYCPQVGPPPAQFTTLPPPPPVAANGACELTIFADPNFAGASAPTGDGQPNLSQTGWLNEISSIQVQAGTWDFFAEENFGGESMRLTAGPYPTLTPEWSKRIGSFMCVQPGPGA
jgi:hypothetical protein